jgi:prepilin-type N-terminal cleavage/methylation domain-containing protein
MTVGAGEWRMFRWWCRQLRSEERGFSLVELVVVLAIIGILVAAAVPLYLGARKKAYKSEANGALQEMKSMEWAYFQENNTFTDSFPSLGFTPPASKFWTYAITVATNSTVTMVATGQAAPLAAGDHVSLTLNSDGSSSSSATF